MSRWEHWSRGSNPPRYFSDFLQEGPVDPVDSGNPSGSGVMSPGDRARAMGLQSDGKGGYIDPKSGQKVAQTVNNELVFYSTAPGGGVTTDGAGGMQTARPTSAWQDPITGLMTVPPGKAETPQEIAAVPDPVPAQMPHGYANFIQKQKQAAYQQDAQARQMQQMMPQPEPQMAPDASSTVPPDPAPMPQMEDFEQAMVEAASDYSNPGLFARMKGIPSTLNTLRDRMRAGFEKNAASGRIPERAQLTPKQEAEPMQQIGNSQGQAQHDREQEINTKGSNLLRSIQTGRELSPGISAGFGDPEIPQPQSGKIKAQLSRGTQELDLGKRRADELNDKKSMATDLIGETPVMEGVYRIMQGISDGTISDELLNELDHEDLEKISEGNREAIKKLRDAVYDTLPTKKRKKGDGWAITSPVVARNIIRMLDPDKKYKVSKSGGGADGMRFTTIPEDQFDFSYDDLNNFLDEKIGKPGMRELMGMDEEGIFDYYDPTDIVMLSEQAPELISSKIDELRDNFDNDVDNENRNAELFKAINNFKRELIGSKDLFNYSLKKPSRRGGKVDNHIYQRNINREADQKYLDNTDIQLKPGNYWGIGNNNKRGIGGTASTMSGLKWLFNDHGVYGEDTLTTPTRSHQGQGPAKNNPNRAAKFKTEPNLSKGSDAQLGMMNMNFRTNPRINDYLGYDLSEQYSTESEPYGAGIETNPLTGKKMLSSIPFTPENIDEVKKLAREVFEYKGGENGNAAQVRGVFEDGQDSDGFIDKLAEMDGELGELFSEISASKAPIVRGKDRAHNFLGDEKVKELKQRFGTAPDVNFRSTIRTKFKQLMNLKILQDIEKNGKMSDFGKNEVFRHAMKLGDEYSPYLISG